MIGSHLPNFDVFMFLMIIFTLTNSEDPGEMQHFVALHLSLHCLSKYSFRSQWLIIHVQRSARREGQTEKLCLARPN